MTTKGQAVNKENNKVRKISLFSGLAISLAMAPACQFGIDEGYLVLWRSKKVTH
jgi:hypothetical protein